MTWSLDARTPVRLHSGPAPGAVWLAEDGVPTPAGAARVERFAAPPMPTEHPMGCACCQPRNPAAIALDRLFMARLKGETPWFSEVLAATATENGAQSLRFVLAEDPVVSARFKPA